MKYCSLHAAIFAYISLNSRWINMLFFLLGFDHTFVHTVPLEIIATSGRWKTASKTRAMDAARTQDAREKTSPSPRPRHRQYSWSKYNKPLKLYSISILFNFNFLFQSLTRDISYCMENLATDSLLRWKLIEQSFLTTLLNHFLLEWLGEFALWAWDWKG